MTPDNAPATGTKKKSSTQRYRLPGIEREGVAQLSLLETALWPLQGGKLPAGKVAMLLCELDIKNQQNNEKRCAAQSANSCRDENYRLAKRYQFSRMMSARRAPSCSFRPFRLPLSLADLNWSAAPMNGRYIVPVAKAGCGVRRHAPAPRLLWLPA